MNTDWPETDPNFEFKRAKARVEEIPMELRNQRMFPKLKLFGWSHYNCGDVAGFFPESMKLDDVQQYLDMRIRGLNQHA